MEQSPSPEHAEGKFQSPLFNNHNAKLPNNIVRAEIDGMRRRLKVNGLWNSSLPVMKNTSNATIFHLMFNLLFEHFEQYCVMIQIV